MSKTAFERESEEDQIIVEGRVQGYPVRLAVDTATTHSVLDFNILLILGYEAADLINPIPIESANGRMDAWLVEVADFSALGRHFDPFQVMTYDYLSKGIFSPHDGVLGLDFFKNTVLTIDFQAGQISLVGE